MVNQRRHLNLVLAQAGLTDEPTHCRLKGANIIITSAPEQKTVHFCQSIWWGEGLTHREVAPHEELARGVAVHFSCHIPNDGHYTVDAVYEFDAGKQWPTLTIYEFQHQSELSDDFSPVWEDVSPAEEYVRDLEEGVYAS